MTTRDITAETAFEPANRAMYLGGTDISAILGFNPFKTAFQCYEEKSGVPQPDREESDILIFGHLLEPVIIKEWLRRNPDWELVDTNAFIVDSEYDFLCYNIDCRIRNVNTGEMAIVEGKTVATGAYKHWRLGVPETYYTQGQGYLGGTGYQRLFFAMLIMDSREFVQLEIHRDDVYIDFIRKEAVKFWDENVCAGVAPEKVAYDWSVTHNSDEEVKGEAADIVLYDDYVAAKAEEKANTAKIAELKERVVMRMRDKKLLLHPDTNKPLFSYGGSDVTRVDTDKLKSSFAEIYTQCSKTKFERKLLVK